MEYNKEYCIYCIYNGGIPFILKTFKTLEAAKAKLVEMIALEEERNRPYFVENNFYENKYVGNIPGKHFSLREREVSEWILYEEKKNISNNIIIYLNNYLDNYKVN